MSESIAQTSMLTRHFGKLTAVDKVNLDVPPNCVYGFLGPNGAGKTTTIRMLLGLIRPDEGKIRLFGKLLLKNRIELLQRVGALVEMPSLYPHLTGYENLEVTRRLIGVQHNHISRVLAITKLEEAAHRRVREYSLGMRQRLGLALALLSEPELLILDEPTNGLDPAGIHEMRDLIRRLPTEYNITIFLSSHHLSEVEQVATDIGIIHQGKLIFQGKLDELQAYRQEHIQLNVSQPEMAVQILAEAGWSVQHHDNNLVVMANGKAAAANINNVLVRRGVEVFSLSIEKPSLEYIFLQLTNTSSKTGE